MEPGKPPLRRCAIYTRKSSEEGLQQGFNSLHAQREACGAFIKSQAGTQPSRTNERLSPLTDSVGHVRLGKWHVMIHRAVCVSW